MTYTVGQMAKMLGLAGSTLRYYDKEGLLPFVERSSGGIRMFREKDYEWLQIIECLKKAGMSIKDIKKYIVLLQQGDSTIQERLELFQHQRTVLLEQMASLQQTLNTLDYKCWYYETALKAGTTDDTAKHAYRRYSGTISGGAAEPDACSHAYQRIAFQNTQKSFGSDLPKDFFIYIYLRLTSNFFASALVSRLMPRTIISRTTAIPNATPNSPLVALR